MNKEVTLLMQLLLAAIGEERRVEREECRAFGLPIEDYSAEDWRKAIDLAFAQGVEAVAAEGYEYLGTRVKGERKCVLETDASLEDLRLEWLGSALQTAMEYDNYAVQVLSLTDIYHQQGLRVVVLKGMACASYYPEPRHRSMGDFDCYLCGCYEQGNLLAEQAGAKVSRSHYKHSHIEYRGLTVENHRFCIATRGSRSKKTLERHLEGLLQKPSARRIAGTSMEIPCADFNALFLTMHAFQHFLSEGVTLRQLLDWACFLQAEQQHIDWNAFYHWTNRLGLTCFANTMNSLAVEHLGINATASGMRLQLDYADRLLQDIFANQSALYHTGSNWKVRLGLVRNQFSSLWKYHKIYRRSMLIELLKSVWGFAVER